MVVLVQSNNMNKLSFLFLKTALGEDGATAMRKSVAKNPDLENYLIPRTLLSFIQHYESGTVGPAMFAKSATGYTLNNKAVESEYHLVAELVEFLGCDVQPFDLTDVELRRLGKSLDSLVKLRKAVDILKTDPPGPSAQPRKPEEPVKPIQPQAPSTGAAKKPKLPKLSMLNVEQNQLGKSCPDCDCAFFKNNRFVGCICTKELAKSVKTTVYGDGVVLDFGSDVSAKEILDLKGILNG